MSPAHRRDQARLERAPRSIRARAHLLKSTFSRTRRAAAHKRLGRVRALQAPLRTLLEADLRRLNDALATTDLAGRYWMFSGCLLGWAREGKILRHDTRDVDFGIRSEDVPHLRAAVPTLNRAGFRCLFQFYNNAGKVTELTFIRRGAQYEFFSMEPVDGRLRYYLYDIRDDPIELEAEQPDQSLVPFDFLNRTWLKQADHELDLATVYGDWRTPDPSWSYLNQPNIVARRRWVHTDYEW